MALVVMEPSNLGLKITSTTDKIEQMTTKSKIRRHGRRDLSSRDKVWRTLGVVEDDLDMMAPSFLKFGSKFSFGKLRFGNFLINLAIFEQRIMLSAPDNTTVV